MTTPSAVVYTRLLQRKQQILQAWANNMEGISQVANGCMKENDPNSWGRAAPQLLNNADSWILKNRMGERNKNLNQVIE